MKVAAVHEALAKANFDADAAILTDVFLRSRNWTLNKLEFPIMDVTFEGSRPLRMRLTCNDWNELPPAAEILNPDGTDYKGESRTGIFNMSAHPQTGRHFICMRGFREYHTHTSHVADLWDTYRNQDGNNLPGLLDQLSRAWRSTMGY